MIKLSSKQVLAVHKMMIEKTGGSDGIRDAGLLESALNSPFQTFDGRTFIRRFCIKLRHCAEELFQITLLLTVISARAYTQC